MSAKTLYTHTVHPKQDITLHQLSELFGLVMETHWLSEEIERLSDKLSESLAPLVERSGYTWDEITNHFRDERSGTTESDSSEKAA